MTVGGHGKDSTMFYFKEAWPLYLLALLVGMGMGW